MLPLILIGAGIGILFASTKGFGFWGKDKNGNSIKEKKIAVLGPSNSGKTHLLHYLSTGEIKKETDPTPFSGEKVKEIRLQEGEKTLILKTTTDYPGSELSIESHYSKAIQESTDIFFIFNCKEFLESEIYRNNTLSIMDFINRHNDGKLIIYFGSHVDKLLKKKDSKKKRIESANRIAEHFTKVLDLSHLHEIQLIDMLSEQEMRSLKKGLFK